MIRFEPTPAPEGFAEHVEKPGAAWLAAHETGCPPNYWRRFRKELADALGSFCAYGAMWEPNGTVDHFVSIKENRSKAYDWSNYRYASALLNQIKGSLESPKMLDPFDVQDEWFEVLIPSMQLVLTERVPTQWRERAQFMLDRLRLAHNEPLVRQRREWFDMHTRGETTLDGLARKAPLIAAAIRKRDT